MPISTSEHRRRALRRARTFALANPAKAVAGAKAARKIGDGAVEPGQPADAAWQARAYDLVDAVGEMGYVSHLTANTAKDGLLTIGPTRDDDTLDARLEQRAAEILSWFVGPDGDQAELVRMAVFHLSVGGETILLGTSQPVGIDEAITWEFLSTTEVLFRKGRKPQRIIDGARVDLPPDAYWQRLHRPRPSHSQLADSPVRRLLPIAEEIHLLDRIIRNSVRGRLNAGGLYVPDELSWSEEDETDGGFDNESDSLDEFTEELIAHITSPIEDHDNLASQIPLLVKGPAEFHDAIHHFDLGPNAADWAVPMRQDALDRLIRSMDAPPEIVEGKGGLNHWCLDDASEILTRRGWIGVDDFQVGDEVLTLNHDTGLAEWQTTFDLYVADVVDEPMVAIDGLMHSSLTTPHHRWPVLRRLCGEAGCDRQPTSKGRCLACWKRARRAHGGPGFPAIAERTVRTWTTSAELVDGDTLILAAPAAEIADSDQVKWTDAAVEVIAWLTTDAGRHNNHALIRQSPTANPEKVLRIRTALDRSGLPYREGYDATTGCAEFWVHHDDLDGLPVRLSGTRYLTSMRFVDSLTAAQTRLFLDACLAANGHVQGGHAGLYAVDGERLDAAEYAAIRLGLRVSRGVQHQTAEAFGTDDVQRLSIGWDNGRTTFAPTAEHRSTVSYTGKVWCPSVANRSFLARRNGKTFYTGNTGASVDFDYIEKYVAPPAAMVCRFITVAYLRPMLVASGISEELAARVSVRFDTSPLTQRADDAAAARLLFPMGLVSEDTVVRASGFRAEDVPDDDEKFRRLILDLVGKAPVTMGPVLLPMLPEFAGINFPTGGEREGGAGENDPDGDGRPGVQREAPQEQPAQPEPPAPEANSIGSRVDLAVQVTAWADMALDRAFERAEARLRSRLQGHADLKARYAKVPRGALLAAVTPADLAAVGTDRLALLDDAFDDVAARVAAATGEPTIAARVARTLTAHAAAHFGALPPAGTDIEGRVPRALLERLLT